LVIATPRPYTVHVEGGKKKEQCTEYQWLKSVLLSGTRGWLFGWKKIEGSTSEHVVLLLERDESAWEVGNEKRSRKRKSKGQEQEDEPKPVRKSTYRPDFCLAVSHNQLLFTTAGLRLLSGRLLFGWDWVHVHGRAQPQ